MTIAAEAGDPRRFPTARQFMACVGLVPSEHSSGSSQHRGRITKTGNRLMRHLVGRIGTNKAVTAVVRELAGFDWAAGQLTRSPASA